VHWQTKPYLQVTCACHSLPRGYFDYVIFITEPSSDASICNQRLTVPKVPRDSFDLIGGLCYKNNIIAN